MITSGLVITLSANPALAAQAIMKIGARPGFASGQLNSRWLPVALEARDDAESRAQHDWLQSLAGVDYVDVVSVNFEEPERGRVEDPPPHALNTSGTTPPRSIPLRGDP